MKNIMKKLILGFVFTIGIISTVVFAHPTKAGVGDTIAQTFPDANLAKAVADQTASGDVNVILTQPMVDSLTELYANNKNISDLTGIGYLKNLKILDLSANKLTSVPAELGSLTNLTKIELYSNQLTELPIEMEALVGLTILDISDNQIKSIPEVIFSLTSLNKLFMDSNQITNVPAQIGNLINLEELVLLNNQLMSIPKEIGNLGNLDILDVGNNKLTSLPIEVWNLNTLGALIIRGNQFTSLPTEIGNMTGLYQLDVRNNQLTNLPVSLENLTNINYSFFGSNLLPTDGGSVLTGLGLHVTSYGSQARLALKSSVSPYTIQSERDWNSINLFDVVEISDGRVVSPTSELIFENFVDENNLPVNINEYIQNGVVLKKGTVFVQVRATGTGLFSTNSDNAITIDKIQLNFEVRYNLEFNLNGATGTPPEVQELLEGETGTTVTNPTRDGYTFRGWNTVADGSGSTWIPGTTPMVGNDVILYAQWQKNIQPEPKKEDNSNTGELSKEPLPKTGGFEMVFFGFITLGSGLLAGAKGIRRK